MAFENTPRNDRDGTNSESPTQLSKPQILDVRSAAFNAFDKDGETASYAQIIDGLSKPVGEKRMPTMLLYDEHGLRLYDDITTRCKEYYLFSAEEDILKRHADEIVRVMHMGAFKSQGHDSRVQSTVVELGAGALRKTSHVLLALSKLVDTIEHKETAQGAPITYYALDLERAELDRCLTLVSSNYANALKEKVDTKGIWGTYDDGLKFIADGGLAHGLPDWEMDDNVSTHIAHGADGLQLPTELKRPGNTVISPSTLEDKPLSPSGSSESDTSSSDSDGPLLTPPMSPEATDETRTFGLNEHMQATSPLHFLFLGSSLGNFSPEEAESFLKALPLKSSDTLLLGLDHDNGKEKIELAYGDPAGVTEAFIMNGLRVAGRVLGDETLFNEKNWEYAHWYDEKERRHIAYYKSKANQDIVASATGKTLSFVEGELVNIEVSYKYSDADAHTLFVKSELRPIMRWTNEARNYSLWLLERPPFTFPLVSTPVIAGADNAPTIRTSTTKDFSHLTPVQKLLHADNPYPFGIPSLSDWRIMWKAWDTITLKMIPSTLLFKKPIDLRHICLFYLGHIPTFLDIFLSRFLGEPHTEPEFFKDIFERGIDPNVDDPTQCHSHSIVPENDDDWPTLESIIAFRDRVRARLTRLYEDLASGKHPLTRQCGRILFMTFEHEVYHAETLLYMLLQSADGTTNGTLPPTGFTPPPWEALAAFWDSEPKPSHDTVTLGPATVVIGHDDDESKDSLFTPETLSESELEEKVLRHEYGWDNEHPKREVDVGRFRISWRPVSNGEYFEYWKKGKEEGKPVGTPRSWVEVGGETQVRTLYGPVSMNVAQNWPVIASYDDLSKYATVHGGRLPTDAELRHFYDKFDIGFESGGGAGAPVGAGKNVGYRNWHPVPATTGCTENGVGGKGHNGGVWEWTSTVLERHEGYVQSKLYPGFSADFFDGHHMVVLGAGYATLPRQANRRSTRNYYQHNYPYAWIGARIVYDN